MANKIESIIKKLKNDWDKSFYQLNENVIYGQRLAKIGSWTYDFQTGEVFWTEEIYKILGCSIKELNKELNSYLSFVHTDDLEIVKKAAQNVIIAKEYDIEYRVVTYNGQLKYVHEITIALYDEHNNPFKVVGVIQDITEQKIRENNLEALGETFNQAQRVAGVGSWKYNVLTDEFYGSDEMFHIYGVEPSDFKNDFNNAIRLIHPEDQFKVQDAMKKHLSGQSSNIEYRIPQKDGTNKFVIGKAEPLLDNKGEVVGVIGTLQDITENKELQNEIELKQEKINKMQKRLQVLVQESSEVYEVINPDGNIVFVSDAIEKVLRCKKEDRVGKNLFEFYKGNESIKLSKMLDLVLNEPDKKVRGDVTFIDKSGKEINLEVDMKNLLNEPFIQGIVINFRDITNRVLMEKRMAYVTTHDDLTKLPNNIHFKKKLRLQCKYANGTNTKFALIKLDINELKKIKNSFGYEFNDQLICGIGQRLKSYLGNIFLSRCAEDQFAIIMHGLKTNEGYENTVRGLIELFTQPFIIDKFEIDVSVNIGVCIYPDDAKDFDAIRKNSNVALHRAIKEGKNLYKFFSTDLDIQYYKEFTLTSDLHKAIEKDQIKVFYQPIVNIKTNEIIAAEALLRWEHPDWGMIAPDEFIPIAEESGLIIDIGKFVIKEVCRNYKKWSDNMKTNIKMSVNFSSMQFLENNFVDSIIEIIDEFKLNPNFLIIEITESILINKIDKVISDIKRLQSYGIQIALDDFGTGYSSLEYLNSFNIDILKIDGSFIKKFITDKTSKVITKFIINMAQELKIKLVAEGIEDWEQLTYLRGLNCYAGQGYIYSKAVGSEDFEVLLARGSCKPVYVKFNSAKFEDRRKYFRINFHQLLESDMTIINIKGKNVNIGNTKVLIKDIGPGGLSFISNIKLPIEKDMNLLFTTQLSYKEIKVYGSPLWVDEIGDNIYHYGLEFTMDENERAELIKILNLVQIKMRKNILFAEGNFKTESPYVYFNTLNK